MAKKAQGSAVGAIGLPAIFTAFFRLGVTSFGGGTAAWLYRAFVQRRQWIDIDAYGFLARGNGFEKLQLELLDRFLTGRPE